MRFAYASACYSGDSDWIQDDLPEAFLRNGARAYMGWQSKVDAATSFDFTDWFYFFAINRGQNVEQAKALALERVPAARGNIKLYGENVSLIPEG